MSELPSRQSLAAVSDALRAVAPVATLGLARRVDGDRVLVLYAYAHGIGEFAIPANVAPAVLLPSGTEIRQIAAPPGGAGPGSFEWLLSSGDVQRIVSVVPQSAPGTRFWIGFADAKPLSDEQLQQVAEIVEDHVGRLNAEPGPQQQIERFQRLELTSDLLPALLHVLDVRQVFDRLSETAKRALPHDLLLLILFNEDLSTLTIFARSDRGADGGAVVANPYPASSIRSWQFDIVDDHQAHPLEQNSHATRLGARSSLRFPIRFDARVIGGLAFLSFQPSQYTTADVPIGRRLADHVAVGLSHHELAAKLAEESRRAEEFRARTTNLELLDDLLQSLIDTENVPAVFDRISAFADKVLSHDAMAMMVPEPDRLHARLYASSGYPPGIPKVVRIPDDILENPVWDHHIFDDLLQMTGENYVRVAKWGFRSLLRVAVRLEGEFAGALIFVSKAVAAFKSSDVLVARRIADRLATALARDRAMAASKRADEANDRASKLEARVRALTDELDSRTGYRRVVGESIQWRQVLMQATQVAPNDTTVLLLGESGTGKEVVARFLHRASTRNSGPFIALNCAALPEQLLEAELFGYERGAYTGATQSKPGQLEQAAGGTLFLDEVGEMSPSAQAKFLRVLQEREFQRLGGTRVLRTDARIVAATNRDLVRAISNGQFREDLYYRLNVFAIRLPTLRDRRDDVLPLSEAFLTELGRGLARPPGGISREARQMLVDYHWPGNVRELRNILERAAILCDGGLITPQHLALDIVAPRPPAPAVVEEVALAAAAIGPSPPVAGSDLQTMERAMIEQALQTARFNKSKAAKALGLTRHQLYIRMRKYGFD